jgi:hypothetical protein
MEENNKINIAYTRNMHVITLIASAPHGEVSEMVIGRCMKAVTNCKTEQESYEILDWIYTLPPTDVSAFVKEMANTSYYKKDGKKTE